MKQDKKYIKQLIEKFFEGASTNEEERLLYKYFSSEGIDNELLAYKNIFNYFESDLVVELKQLESKEKSEMFVKNGNKKHLKLILFSMAIAASFLLLMIFNPFSTKEFNPYEGSYARINGQLIEDSDTKLFKEKEAEIMNQVEETERMYQELIDNVNNKTEEYEELLQSID